MQFYRFQEAQRRSARPAVQSAIHAEAWRVLDPSPDSSRCRSPRRGVGLPGHVLVGEAADHLAIVEDVKGTYGSAPREPRGSRLAARDRAEARIEEPGVVDPELPHGQIDGHHLAPADHAINRPILALDSFWALTRALRPCKMMLRSAERGGARRDDQYGGINDLVSI